MKNNVFENERIQANDFVKHLPTGEEWVVCGVNNRTWELIPCGYPFPSIVPISDCELIEKRHHLEPQSEEYIKALQKEGLTDFIDVASAYLHGIL
jgi:hypothetical protein